MNVKLIKKLKKCSFKYFEFKKWLYQNVLSTCKAVEGDPILAQPVLFLGQGKIKIDNTVMLGYNPSPFLYSHYMHIEARQKTSVITIGKNTAINNNAQIISDGAIISIGKDCLIGYNFAIYDSDFHLVDPVLRRVETPVPQNVRIGDNVFIGSNVMILKGVTIGTNSVIAAGSIVTKSFPENSVIAGNPARLIKLIEINKA